MSQGTTRGIPIDTDVTFVTASNLTVPSRLAVKTYADTKLSISSTSSMTVLSSSYSSNSDLALTSSYITSSNVFGVVSSASYALNAPNIATGSKYNITSSWSTSSSYASSAGTSLSSSYITSSNVFGVVSSASYAVSASSYLPLVGGSTSGTIQYSASSATGAVGFSLYNTNVTASAGTWIDTYFINTTQKSAARFGGRQSTPYGGSFGEFVVQVSGGSGFGNDSMVLDYSGLATFAGGVIVTGGNYFAAKNAAGTAFLGVQCGTPSSLQNAIYVTDTTGVKVKSSGNSDGFIFNWQQRLGVNTITPSAGIHVVSAAAGTVGQIIQAASSQTADLLQCQNSSAVSLLSISSSGALTTAGDIKMASNQYLRFNNIRMAYGQTSLSNWFFGNSGNPTLASMTGGNCVGIGDGAMAGLTSATNAVAIGVNAMAGAATGDGAVAIGRNAALSSTSAGYYVAIGYRALNDNVTGNAGSVAIGQQALERATTGTSVAVGYYACNAQIGGSANCAFGTAALQYNTTGNYNNAFGYQALNGILGDGNIGIGAIAGGNTVSGSNNIYIGYNAATNHTSGSKNIIIGASISAPSATGSNQLNIGNIIFGTGVTGTTTTIAGLIGIACSSPAAQLEVDTVTNSTVGILVKGSVSQTSDLFQVKNSSGSLLASISNTGSLSAGAATFSGSVTFPGGTLLTTSAALTNGSASFAGTLSNAPVSGNPTKWIPINDNGTTRYIPAW